MSQTQPFIVVVPARAASSRLPNKMLADIAGLPMVVRTAQQARLSKADSVLIATDHQRIYEVAKQYDIEALMTQEDHPSGTDRLAEAATALNLPDEAVVVNVQGDEPLIHPDLINRVAQTLYDHPEAHIATAVCPLRDKATFADRNCVKAVMSLSGRALYFSRAPIPHCRNPMPEDEVGSTVLGYQHIGIYAYKVSFLRTFPTLSKSPLENAESLEQLRALEHGYQIQVMQWHEEPIPGVDSEDDLLKIRNFFKTRIGVKPD